MNQETPKVADGATGALPGIVPREAHTISRGNISEGALKVLYRLKKAGYEGYLVGGSVRDLLLGREPKDFDVATDADPEEVKALFRNSRLIGRRFRLVHVRFGKEIVEVATFRAHHSQGDEGECVDGRIVRDNVYGTLDEDALRRDFTVNALYYNIQDFSVVDFTTGMADLERGLLRFIGDAETRLREDPVRMLRVVRFAARLGFRVDAEIERLMPRLGELLVDIPPARLFDEVLKLFHYGYALETFELLRHYDLYRRLFPASESMLAREQEGFPRLLIAHALENTDHRVQEGKAVNPAFLFAAFLWEPMREAMKRLSDDLDEQEAMQEAADEVLAAQVSRVALPRRFSAMVREIWTLQLRLTRTTGKRPTLLLGHPRFRAAYDFLLIRARAGEPVAELAEWWTQFQESDPAAQAAMMDSAPKKKRRRRRRPRRPREAPAT